MNQKLYPKVILIFVLNFVWMSLSAQNSSYITIDKNANGKTLSTLVTEYEKRFKIDIVFEDKSSLNKKIKGISRPMALTTFLKALLPSKHVKKSKGIFLVLDKNIDITSTLVVPIKKNGSFFRAKVYDVLTGVPVDGANIFFTKNKSGTVTSRSGDFMAVSKQDIIIANVSFIGYKQQKLILVSSKRTKSNVGEVPIEVSSGLLSNVYVSAKKQDDNIKIEKIGVQKLEIKHIKELPTFLGEIDPIKGITTLPGVSSTGDIGSGFSVRGGENSQNLILQDGAVIFNPSHLFGFFSAFNPDFISQVVLLKGGGPAKYGGRVASVLDIQTRHGDVNKYSVSGGVGLVSSRLTTEGPIKKGKSSFMIGGRVSYSDWFIKSFDDAQLKKSSAKFHDLTANFFQQISEKLFISVTGYYSSDDFNLGVDSTFSWTTKNLSINIDHKHSSKSRSKLMLTSSNYSSGVLYDNEIFGFNYENGINVLTLNYNNTFEVGPKLKFVAGVNNNFTKILPGKSTPYPENSISNPNELNNQRTIESAIFVEGGIDITERLSLNVGLRYSSYFRFGEDEIYTFDHNNIEGRAASITDTTYYGRNELIANYGGFEPRISLRYMISESASIKAGYSKTQQFLHQISTTTSPSPVDFWISSSTNILPQVSHQYSLGYFQNFLDNIIESSVEGFYSNTNNVVDYIAGVDLYLNNEIEGALIQGNGYSYGLEFLIKKKQGMLNGWIAYTYSRSLRVMEGQTSEFAINNGEEYPSAFDQPHQLSLILNWQMAPQVVLSSNFTYNTGRPITIPVSKYSYGNTLSVKNYSNRNEYRIPDYHRLDLSLTINSKKKPGKKFSSDIVISLYNVYARKNAYAIYFNNNGQAYKTSIIGSMIPSISYNFKIN